MTKRKTSRGRQVQRSALKDQELVRLAYRYLRQADDAVRSAREEDAIRDMPAYSSHMAHALLLTASEHAGAATAIYYDVLGGNNMPTTQVMSNLLADLHAVQRRTREALVQIEN